MPYTKITLNLCSYLRVSFRVSPPYEADLQLQFPTHCLLNVYTITGIGVAANGITFIPQSVK